MAIGLLTAIWGIIYAIDNRTIDIEKSCRPTANNQDIKNQTIDAEKLCGLVKNTLMDIAQTKTASEFRNSGKPIKTQKGDYRVDYKKAYTAKYAELTAICFDGNYLCDDMKEYVKTYYPSLKRKELYSMIRGFLDYHQKLLDLKFDAFNADNKPLTPDEFFKFKEKQDGDVVGVYIIHNKSKNMYYVGQAKRLFFRLNQHFTGHGNGVVYADYKYGDDFTIQMIKLSDSGYYDLDKLEKDMIQKYDAYNSGYNRTSGNS
jgi:hypothetical protein